MKKIRILIIGITVVLMCCVWPINLIRKGADVEPFVTEQNDVGNTAAYITADAPYVQSFAAQTSKLNEIAFTVGYDGSLPEDGVLLFELMDENGKVLAEHNASFTDIRSCTYYTVPIERQIKKGKQYAFRLSVPEKYSGLLYGYCTMKSESHAAGSIQLSIGNETMSGMQGYTKYEYGYPLNIKNVICLWAFLLLIGFAAYELTKGEADR